MTTLPPSRVDVSKLKLRAVADWVQQTLRDAKVPDALTQDIIRGRMNTLIPVRAALAQLQSIAFVRSWQIAMH